MRVTRSPISSQSGYTLIEMLIVIGIIGIISLVTVPNFVAYHRTGKIKNAMRTVTSDLRDTRQLAITRNTRTKFSFQIGGSPSTATRSYAQFEERTNPTTGAKTWSRFGGREMDPAVYFSSTGFADTDADSLNDVIFLPNGTVANIPTGSNLPRVQIKTDQQIPRPIYNVNIRVSGQLQVDRP